MIARIEEHTLNEAEKRVLGLPDNGAGSIVTMLINALRDAYHALDHPNFMYAGSRVTRSSIMYRDNEIERLKAERDALKKEVEELKKPRLPNVGAPVGIVSGVINPMPGILRYAEQQVPAVTRPYEIGRDYKPPISPVATLPELGNPNGDG
jgi:hypothetical protein